MHVDWLRFLCVIIYWIYKICTLHLTQCKVLIFSKALNPIISSPIEKKTRHLFFVLLCSLLTKDFFYSWFVEAVSFFNQIQRHNLALTFRHVWLVCSSCLTHSTQVQLCWYWNIIECTVGKKVFVPRFLFDCTRSDRARAHSRRPPGWARAQQAVCRTLEKISAKAPDQ